jgi:hypothetical protein
MDNVSWQPTNEPDHYDVARVATLKPIRQAIEQLQLPVIRLRKLKAILNALEMQIEDGGDSPEVNSRLLEALQLAVLHQVGQQRATTVLQTILDFTRAEETRWKQARTVTSPPSQDKTGSAKGNKNRESRRKFRSGQNRRKKK